MYSIIVWDEDTWKHIDKDDNFIISNNRTDWRIFTRDEAMKYMRELSFDSWSTLFPLNSFPWGYS